MKKRIIIASILAVVLLIAFMGIGGFAQVTEDVSVNAIYGAALSFTMTPAAIDFGTIVPTDPAVAQTETSVVSVKSNRLWNFTLTTTPNLHGAVTAFDIGDTYFTFLQNNGSAGVTFDVANGGFQANTGALLAHGTRGVKTWDFNFELLSDYEIPADTYALDGGGFQVYTVTQI